MFWRVTLTDRVDGESYYDFEDQHRAIRFFMKKFFMGNYSKREIELIKKKAWHKRVIYAG